MGSRNRLAPSPTSNPPSPMPVPQQSMGPAPDAMDFAAWPSIKPAVLNEMPGNPTNSTANSVGQSLPADFNPAFFGQPISSGTGNPFEVSGQQQFKMPPMGGQIGQGGPAVGQGGPAVGGKCPTCGK
jgi:hypothetical protein